MYATPNAANIASLESMIESYNRDVKGEPIGNGTQAGWRSEEVQQQQDSRAYAAARQLAGRYSGGEQGPAGTQSTSRKSVCTDYLYKGCIRPDCRYAHPHLSELKGLMEASKSGGQVLDSKKEIQLRKPSPLRTALKRPPTPIRQPPAKKLSFANLVMAHDQPEQDEGDDVEGESGAFDEGGEDDTYR